MARSVRGVRRIGRWTAGAALAGALGAVSAEAGAVEIGAGVGIASGQFDPAVALEANAYVGLPGIELIHIGGDVTYYLIDGATLLAVDPNVQLRFVRVPLIDVYGLAGLNVLYAHVRAAGISANDTDVGLNLGAGAELKLGPLHPFAELKGALHDSAYAEGIAGLRLAL